MKESPLVWIIDDDDISTYVMKRNLNELGITKLTEFSDSVHPLEIASKHRKENDKLPDIIFLDLNMPVLNGFQFLEEFKTFSNEVKKQIHIFMLTSSLCTEDLAFAKAESVISEYFVKPISLEKLALTIDSVMVKLKEA